MLVKGAPDGWILTPISFMWIQLGGALNSLSFQLIFVNESGLWCIQQGTENEKYPVQKFSAEPSDVKQFDQNG